MIITEICLTMLLGYFCSLSDNKSSCAAHEEHKVELALKGYTLDSAHVTTYPESKFDGISMWSTKDTTFIVRQTNRATTKDSCTVYMKGSM